MPIPHSHTYIPHPISPGPPGSAFEHHAHGPTVYIRSSDTLARFDINAATHIWSTPCSGRYGPPGETPSMMVSAEACLWSSTDGRLVAALVPTSAGITVRAHDAASGHQLWERTFPSRRVHEGAELSPETCEHAMLIPRRDALNLAITTSPLLCQPIDAVIHHIDPSSGKALSTRELSDLSFTLALAPTLRHAAHGHSIDEIDWLAGTKRHLAGPFPQPPSDPTAGRDGVYTSWHDRRGTISIARLHHTTGERLACASWRRAGIDDSLVHEHDGTVLLRINNSTAVLLDESLSPRWEATAKPYIYDIAALPDSPLLIATAGNGGSLYALVRATGKEILCLTPPGGGGVPALHRIDGTDLFAAHFAPGLLLINARTLDHTHLTLPGSPTIVGSHQGRLAAFAFAPEHAGLHILQPE